MSRPQPPTLPPSPEPSQQVELADEEFPYDYYNEAVDPNLTELVEPRCADDWPVIFEDLVLHQQEKANKAIERLHFARSLLFPEEQAQGEIYARAVQAGLDNYARLVAEQGQYIDFGSGKKEVIQGAHGKSSAIIHLLQSTDRAIADLGRFLDRSITPEAVQQKCAARGPDQCGPPCNLDKSIFRSARCRYN